MGLPLALTLQMLLREFCYSIAHHQILSIVIISAMLVIFVSFTSPEHLQALENFPCSHHGSMFFSMENYGKIMGFHDAATYHICL